MIDQLIGLSPCLRAKFDFKSILFSDKTRTFTPEESADIFTGKTPIVLNTEVQYKNGGLEIRRTNSASLELVKQLKQIQAQAINKVREHQSGQRVGKVGREWESEEEDDQYYDNEEDDIDGEEDEEDEYYDKIMQEVEEEMERDLERNMHKQMFGDEEDYHYEEAFPAKHNIKEIKKIGTKIEDKPTLKEDQEWETDEEDEEYDDDDEEEEEEGFSSIKSDLEDFKN